VPTRNRKDWVFASPHVNGTQPYWPGTLNRWHLQKAVKQQEFRVGSAGILSGARMPLSSRQTGRMSKTVQELLRHANSLVTMNLYAQAVTEVKRKRRAAL